VPAPDRNSLVTSRETRRWIIPKGWPKKGKSPDHSAAREAFEEAGVVGAIAKR
jgi:8-oxo-dGTP pyrophosphatase MutT (NUDIX family)